GLSRDLPSFPTRRSSDLVGEVKDAEDSGFAYLAFPTGLGIDDQRPHPRCAGMRGIQSYGVELRTQFCHPVFIPDRGGGESEPGLDRKSTRLNSSHVKISY